MARILFSAYACEPGRGSEPGVGWSWVTEAARLGHQVWVLTRANNRGAIENNPLSQAVNLAFLYYDLPKFVQKLRALFGKRLYYVLWQWNAVWYVRRLFPTLPFDYVHHVTYASARYPSFMGALKIPFHFGPVSGGETVPRLLRPGLPLGQRFRELMRDLWNVLVPFDPVMRWTFAQAEKILVTRDTRLLIPERWRKKCVTSLAVGLPLDGAAGQSQADGAEVLNGKAKRFEVLFVGRLLGWKGADLALHVMRQLRQECPEVRIRLVGSGPEQQRLRALTRELAVADIVRWRDWLPQEQLQQVYREADVFLYPSLRDSGAMVVLEALAQGLPVVTTDLGGPGELVNHRCGRVISTAGRNRDEVVMSLATALAEIAASPVLRDYLAQGAKRRVEDFRFERLVRLVYSESPAPAGCQG